MTKKISLGLSTASSRDARLSFSLQKCVDHLDRVLAGCCWEVYDACYLFG